MSISEVNYDDEWKERSKRKVSGLMQEPKRDVYVGGCSQVRILRVLRTDMDGLPGRSVKVMESNVNDAYRTLMRRLSGNNVMKELRQAARHEKKGDKRRRLQSERHRRRFAAEVRFFGSEMTGPFLSRLVQVRKKVQVVQQIRNRGS
jgi:ribosomal protein S21